MSLMELDPASWQPLPGKVVVQIVEVLGGMSRGGVFIPGHVADQVGKDTFYGLVLTVGDLGSVVKRGRDGEASYALGDKPWPEEYRSIKPGDMVVFPRDVPLAFHHAGLRYAIVLEHEAIVAIPEGQFKPEDFEVVSWVAAEKIAGQVGS